MRKRLCLLLILIIAGVITVSFRHNSGSSAYTSRYLSNLDRFGSRLRTLIKCIDESDMGTEAGIEKINGQIRLCRQELKRTDFWFRYLEPLAYKKINSPLPVEWETEVFEKFEKPYRRDGAGLTLAALYLGEETPDRDSLKGLISSSLQALETYGADSITGALMTHDHFYLCNRLFLLNLAAIYTTGFECPDGEQVIPELRLMLDEVGKIYAAFNQDFPDKALTSEYLALYDRAVLFAGQQPSDLSGFDHYSFIRDYVNPLFTMNQEMILRHKVVSRSMVDYSLNKQSRSIFDKSLYHGQNAKGIFLRVKDEADLQAIDRLGKMLFYDPILSGNNMRSCASCHRPDQYFTDTTVTTPLQFNRHDPLPRNTPTLLNASYNHLIMADGKHISLQDQTRAVITDPKEMGSDEKKVLEKVLGCREYREGFKKLLKYTPQEPEIGFSHISSAITFYYSKFSGYNAPFDVAMNRQAQAADDVVKGFNLFMGKAQCGTCHFVPQFNGVKPPYIGSEFEVLGVPGDTAFSTLSRDNGRYDVHPADETLHAFRTGTVRNAAYTKPYMHNGVFSTLEEVIDFYDAGGGAGRGLKVENQTLSSDSLKLTALEKKQLIAFIHSLTEEVVFEEPPVSLPVARGKSLKDRKPGGIY